MNVESEDSPPPPGNSDIEYQYQNRWFHSGETIFIKTQKSIEFLVEAQQNNREYVS